MYKVYYYSQDAILSRTGGKILANGGEDMKEKEMCKAGVGGSMGRKKG